MDVIQIHREDWKGFSESAHRAVFGTIRTEAQERIDYALLAVVEGFPVGYVTVREQDAETAYWPYGGAVPQWHGTLVGGRLLKACLDKQRTLSRRVLFRVENSNLRMLRLALSQGFLIVGLRHVLGSTLVEMALEFS